MRFTFTEPGRKSQRFSVHELTLQRTKMFPLAATVIRALCHPRGSSTVVTFPWSRGPVWFVCHGLTGSWGSRKTPERRQEDGLWLGANICQEATGPWHVAAHLVTS